MRDPDFDPALFLEMEMMGSDELLRRMARVGWESGGGAKQRRGDEPDIVLSPAEPLSPAPRNRAERRKAAALVAKTRGRR